MWHRNNHSDDARIDGDRKIARRRREGRGRGPFSGTQLTIVIVAVTLVLAPTAAIAAIGTFTSSTMTPAVKGTNSSTAANAKGVEGIATAGAASAVYGVSGSANASTNGVGVNGSGKKWGVLGVSAGTALNASGVWGNATAASAVDHFGVWGNAGGTGGIGVKGTGAKYGVYSNGPLGVAAGKTLSCTGCVEPAALSAAAKNIQPLASGQSESGVWGAASGDSVSGHAVAPITFARPVGTTSMSTHLMVWFNNEWLDIDTLQPIPGCPSEGDAAAHHLCLYVRNGAGSMSYLETHAYDDTGVLIYFTISAAGSHLDGTYTVAAP
jgi:hypothetical protein